MACFLKKYQKVIYFLSGEFLILKERISIFEKKTMSSIFKLNFGCISTSIIMSGKHICVSGTSGQGAKMYVRMAAVLTGNFLSIIFFAGNIFALRYSCKKKM